MRHLLAGLFLGTLLIAGCNSERPIPLNNVGETSVVQQPRRNFTVIEHIGGRLSGADVVAAIATHGIDARLGRVMLDVVTPLGSPDKLQFVMIGDREIGVYEWSAPAVAATEFEAARVASGRQHSIILAP